MTVGRGSRRAGRQAAFESIGPCGSGPDARRAPGSVVGRLENQEDKLWMAFFRDPDSNLLALMKEVR